MRRRQQGEPGAYRYLRRRWVEILNGEDIHAISTQLTSLLERDLEFRTINAARRISQKESVPQNGTVHWLIDYGFIAHQVLAIRRIVDDGGREEVYSLRCLVDEVENHRQLITRENSVCNSGQKFDAPITDIEARHLHEVFDELAQTTQSSRSRDDLIQPEVFRDLRSRFKSSESVRRYANKFLAHAAAPGNRPQDLNLTLEVLRAACRDLIYVARRLSARILWSQSRDFLPTYACNLLQHLDSPFCPSGQFDELAREWRASYRELRELDRGP